MNYKKFIKKVFKTKKIVFKKISKTSKKIEKKVPDQLNLKKNVFLATLLCVLFLIIASVFTISQLASNEKFNQDVLEWTTH